jgi:hypothetical protein
VSDGTTLDLKDDRLVSPPVAVATTSHLVFRHRFDLEGGFDGGVLEASTDGGASWADVGAAAFLQGGYNGVISTEFGNPVAGRQAWTGSSGSVDGMQRVEVDLGAVAGTGVLLRWRLAADPLVPGSLPGVGWWIDDVQVVELVEECQLPPVAEDDFATTPRDTPVTIDVLANDSDPDGDPLTVTSVGDPAHGSATDNGDGTVTYTPDSGFVGDDSFPYTIGDGAGGADDATVFVTVEDQPSGATEASAGGWIPVAGGGKLHLSATADGEASPPIGRIGYDGRDAGGPRIRGTVTAVSFPSPERAVLTGSCDAATGPCTFELTLEDRGEPGAGVDSFSIEIFDGSGQPSHAAGGVLGGGNVQVQ